MPFNYQRGLRETNENKSEPPRGGKIIYLLLALAPMPMGFLFSPLRLFNLVARNNVNGSGAVYGFSFLTLIFCIVAAVGMCGGFKKGKSGARMAGVCMGLVLAGV